MSIKAEFMLKSYHKEIYLYKTKKVRTFIRTFLLNN